MRLWPSGENGVNATTLLKAIGSMMGLLMLLGNLSCDRNQPSAAPPDPSHSDQTAESAPSSESEAESDPSSQPSQPSNSSPEPPPNPPPQNSPADSPEPAESAAPPSASQSALPQSLIQTWEPLSSVLFTFGPMIITPTEVRWQSGQITPYTVVEISGDSYALKLESAPSFYDVPHPYLRLVSQTDTQEVEAYFYETLAQLEQDNYVMFGVYFVE